MTDNTEEHLQYNLGAFHLCCICLIDWRDPNRISWLLNSGIIIITTATTYMSYVPFFENDTTVITGQRLKTAISFNLDESKK